ncbi:hypothetical protein Agub_g7513 [Astrephomene gubernaculifera]|uniref:Coenzyme Q-binding protein COQ10 START domain-containing protein n=1 Tax=Astrephomene gubernaculifera TaxID=47775 RepID=A0AAD3DRW5_9CHLO|nr:hypothetical protein Agub_g7513 [Astrephomene gubernaculifera]
MKALRTQCGNRCSKVTSGRVALPFRGSARSLSCRGTVAQRQADVGVRIDVEKTSWNSRRIFAAVTVPAPKGNVWSALTDYDHLADFIPSLVQNRCLERSGNTATLYQVGAQDVAMGVRFSAAVTLRCSEYPDGGLPEGLMTPPPPGSCTATGSTTTGTESSSSGLGRSSMATSSSDSQDSSEDGGSSSSSSSSSNGGSSSSGGGKAGVEELFPYPTTTVPGVRASDISFELLEGDFQTFRGIWRMQPTGERTTLLSYALYVKPQSWLPVALIQGRIENEVVRNLEAVSRYAESQYQQEQQQQRLQGQL